MNIHSELEALKENLLADTRIIYCTAPQIGGVNGLIRKGLEHKSRKVRVAVLKRLAGEAMEAIHGYPFESSKALTSPAASFLINLLLEPDTEPWELSSYGKKLIMETEKLVLKEEFGIEQLEIEV